MAIPESHPAAPRDESELLQRLRAGDSVAFEELVRTDGPRLLAAAQRILGSEAEAQDALQEALISAFRRLDQFEGGSKLSTWLHRIVINASLMRLRQRRRQAEVSIDDLLPAFSSEGFRTERPSRWTPPDAALARAEVREKVRTRIEQLPADYRDVIILRDIEQLDTQATAEALQIAPGAVKTRLHRARQALRALLADDFASETL